MLCDVLQETVERIENYERAMPRIYSPHAKEIAALKMLMRKLQRNLRAPVTSNMPALPELDELRQDDGPRIRVCHVSHE
jgi:hypothetical protein